MITGNKFKIFILKIISRDRQGNVIMQGFTRPDPSFPQKKKALLLNLNTHLPQNLCFIVYSVLLTRLPLKPIAISFEVCL